MLTQPGSTALSVRKSDFEAFFNAGGGIFANTGLSVASYYDSLPLTVGAGANTSHTS